MGAEMTAVVQRRAGELRSKSFADLTALPEHDTGDVEILGKPVHLTVHRNIQDSGDVLVVVQAARDRYFGITTQIRVEGFIARPNGETAQAPERLLWDYT